MYMYVCISYIPGMSALPNIYAQLPRGMQHPRVSEYISGKARVPAWDITNMLHFLYSALLNLPSLTKHPAALVGDTAFDCGFIFQLGHGYELLSWHKIGFFSALILE